MIRQGSRRDRYASPGAFRIDSNGTGEEETCANISSVVRRRSWGTTSTHRRSRRTINAVWGGHSYKSDVHVEQGGRRRRCLLLHGLLGIGFKNFIANSGIREHGNPSNLSQSLTRMLWEAGGGTLILI